MGRVIDVPLFPLPSTVLFPSVRLPFYVFEPRYRAMLQEVLDGPGLVGVPLLLPGFESTYDGSPPIAPVFGVGSVERYITHQDGTSHIEVMGRWRVRLAAEHPSRVYRRARVEMLPEPLVPSATGVRLRRALRQALDHLGQGTLGREGRRQLRGILADRRIDTTAVINLLSTLLADGPAMKQRLLECPEAQSRAHLLAQFLVRLGSGAGSRRSRDHGQEEGS